MLGLANGEKTRLILSVGKGGVGGYRPLTPVEVAEFLERSVSAGDTAAVLSKELTIGQDMIARFLRLLSLPETVRCLIDWKVTSTTLSFSTASEIARLADPKDQISLATRALELGFSKADVQQVVQRKIRSHDSLEASISSILALRPEIERRHIIIGAILDAGIREVLKGHSQAERDRVAVSVGQRVQARTGAQTVARLTPQYFTIFASNSAYENLRSVPVGIESFIDSVLKEAIDEL